MTFPDSYTCLDRQVFSKNEYYLIPIRFQDRYKIMKWRNEQIYHLRQNKPLEEKDQDQYFQNIVARLFDQEQPNQILFSFLEGDKCIGYGGLVHINWVDKNAEISFIMDTSLEASYFENYWHIFLKLIEEVAFEELTLHKIFTYALDLRPKLYPVLKNSGYVLEAVLKNHCLYNLRYVDVIIHSKFRID
ncbi:MAG: GNAT family N-acetyltransferase [Chitinophagaceae bacterium]|nr:MAG: GNAT family N-acetyltransferase [Chitinophagaceae bacterium]